MYQLPLQRYRRVHYLLPFELLADKLYGVLVLACVMPLLTLSSIALFASGPWPIQLLLGIAGLTSVATLLLAIWLIHAIVSPVSLARSALHAYHREQRVIELPDDLDGEAGGLLNDVRTALEACERHRQVFADQADWAFRSKHLPSLGNCSAPCAAHRLQSERPAA